MHRVLCSTGAIITRKNNRDYTLLRRMVPQIDCDGLEFMMYDSWHACLEPLRQVLADFPVPVFHMTKQIGEWISQDRLAEALPLFREDCALAASLGAELLALHLWSGVASDRHIERNIAAYPVLREMAEKHGLLLTVENVICNTRDPMTHMRTLAEAYPDIAFTYDTKMAAFHGQLEALYQPENAWLWPHIKHFHVNDYAGGYMDFANLSVKALGKGHIDLARFFDFVRGMDYAGDFTHEGTAINDDASIRYEELNGSLRRIKREVSV